MKTTSAGPETTATDAEGPRPAARFGVPHVLPLHVPRPHLVAALDDAGAVPLVLVSGPAGSGKTSLLAEWLQTGTARDPLGWVTFEDEDTRLWQPLLDCLATLGLPVPYAASAPPPDQLLGRSALRRLAGTIASSERRWTLVVDGYELRSPELAAEVTYLLDHSEGLLRLVFAARVDPVLPLYRFRLRAAIAELRAADLRFTDLEAGTLLERCDVPLPPEAVHELNGRLGGWVAGLRFAARALARHPHPAESVAAVVGQDTDIREYLLAEVLQVQEPTARDLLLRTCVPDVLPSGLAEELAGPQAVRGLDELARANMFLEPVPDHPGAHRYHPVFRDLLRTQLAYEDPATAAELHRRAAAWWHSRGKPARSVAQLATGSLWPDVARQLVEDLLVVPLLIGQDERLLETARRIPDDPTDPATCLVRAAIALAVWDPDACAAELDRARMAAAAGTTPAEEPWVLSLLVIDAVRACGSDDADTADSVLEAATRALTAGQRPAGLVHPELEGLLEGAGAVVALRRGDLSAARAGFTRAEALPGLPTRFRSALLGCLALTDALDGRLTQAQRRAEASLTAAEDCRIAPEMRNAAAAAALALVALERDDLGAARRHVNAARACTALACDPVSRTVIAGVTAYLEAGVHGGRTALAHLESVCDLAEPRDPWLAAWLRLRSAELALAHGLPEHALKALDRVPATPARAVDAALAYAEQGRSVPFEQSLVAARSTARTLPVEVARLLALGVHEARRHQPGPAASMVEQALELAAREGLRRPFHTPPPSVRRLLAEQPGLAERHPWLPAGPGRPTRPAPRGQRQRTPVVTASRPGAAPPGPPSASAPASRAPSPRARRTTPPRAAAPAPGGSREDPTDLTHLVIDPLTAKELEVLRHLEELLTTEEIAERMFVSVNTIRTHVRSILRKLGVNRRNNAVRRARALGLLDPVEDDEPAGAPLIRRG